MAFKSIDAYNESRYRGMFLLRNDGDYADVIFMYRDRSEVLIADTHYINSADYTGYIHCCGHGCPACAKGIRVQTKLFVPLYVISEGRILFFDRNMRFDNQLNSDVISRYPNPSEYVFRITRRGAANDVNTRYDIRAVGKNTLISYDEILAKLGVSLPEYYDTICKEFTAAEVDRMINVVSTSGSSASDAYDMPSYKVTPRVTAEPVTTVTTMPYTAPVIPATYTSPSVDNLSEELVDVSGDEDIDDISF